MQRSDDAVRAGFWARLAALWIDILLVAGGTLILFRLAVHAGWYFPLELTAIAAGWTYAVVATGWKGRTLGKWLCGLRVCAMDEARPGVFAALIRETVGKILSSILLAGFLRVAWSRSKRGWHDSLAGTVVLREQTRVSRAFTRAALALCAIAVLTYVREVVHLARVYASVAPSSKVVKRGAVSLREANSLTEADGVRLAEWPRTHGSDPVEYAVQKARQHRLVIFGERHNQRPALEYLHRVIPHLYRDAGLTFVAMETLMAEDNDHLNRLVTADAFDRGAVWSIAREDPWGAWGHQQYWDVVEIVWRLNRERPAGKPPLKLVGLGLPLDLQSFEMAGFEKGADPRTSRAERLRLLRFPVILPRAIVRDAWLAREAARHVNEPGSRGIIWVGGAHSWIRCPRPGSLAGDPRMGFMLAQRYGREVAQVRIHYPFTPTLTGFLETAMTGLEPVAFDVDPSPIADVRDSAAFEFRDPKVSLRDAAEGYVYLGKAVDAKPCTWMKGFVTDEMYTRARPFYQALARRAGKNVNSAAELDTVLATMQ